MKRNKFIALIPAFVIAGCSSIPANEAEFSNDTQRERKERFFDNAGQLFGGDVSLVGGNSKELGTSKRLWSAALKSVESFPLKICDEDSGTIQTDWHSTSSKDKFQIKISIYPSDKIDIRSVDVKVFHKVMSQSGEWIEAPASKALEKSIKEKILSNLGK